MKPVRVILLVAMVCWVVSLAPAQDTTAPTDLHLGPGTVVDNDDETGVVISGKWIAVKSNPKDRHGKDFVFIKGGQAGTGITFRPSLPADGQYAVFVRYLTMSSSSQRVAVTIRHADGESVHTLDQRKGAGQWQELGRFSFTAKGDSEVFIDAAGADGLVTADAIMFSRLVTMAELKRIEAQERAAEEAKQKAEWEIRRQRGLSATEGGTATPAEPARPPEEITQEYYQAPETLEEVRKTAQERLDETTELIGVELTLYETDHFLIYTDINAKTANEVAVFAERLEKVLRNPFDIPADEFLWPGKLVVWVFKNRKDYLTFKYELDNSTRNRSKDSSGGYARSQPFYDNDRNIFMKSHVCISYENPKDTRGSERTNFFDAFAHETTHILVASWPMAGVIPLWFNEGLAEFTSGEAVSKADAAYRRQTAYRQVRSSPGAVVSMMADNRNDISGGRDGTIDEYGVAQSLVRYLYLAKKEGLFTCYHLLKQGKTTDQAMQEAFGLTTRKFAELWCRKAKNLPGGP